MSSCILNNPLRKSEEIRRQSFLNWGFIGIALVLWILGGAAMAGRQIELKIPECFGDNMVLCARADGPNQRSNFLWGWVTKTENVWVTIGSTVFWTIRDRSARSGDMVFWSLRYDHVQSILGSTGPLKISIGTDRKNVKPQIQFTNVYLGEVWVVSVPKDTEISVAERSVIHSGESMNQAPSTSVIRVLKNPVTNWTAQVDGTLRGRAWALGAVDGLPTLVTGAIQRRAARGNRETLGLIILPRWGEGKRQSLAEDWKPAAASIQTAPTYLAFADEYREQKELFDKTLEANRKELERARREIDDPHIQKVSPPWPHKPMAILGTGPDFPLVVTGIIQ